MSTENGVILDSISGIKSKPQNTHIPSSVQADTLFTFTTDLDFLLPCIEKAMLSPRYCIEDIKYLKLTNLKKIAYPMKCFCDINLHRIAEHLAWYGYYGLAFSKEWGMKKKIQPIQYINPDSDLRKDFSSAFKTALKADVATESNTQRLLKDYLLHEMMYYKPYSGIIKNRNTEKRSRKCFTDECEWRYIPDVSVAGFEQVLFDEDILNAGNITTDLSNAMFGIPEISLEFNYEDIKYIIIKDSADFNILTKAILALDIADETKHELISKTIVWDNSKGDF